MTLWHWLKPKLKFTNRHNHNSTHPNITKVGFDMKMTLHNPPTHHKLNVSNKSIISSITRFWPSFEWKVSGIKQQHYHPHQQQQQQNKHNNINKYISTITCPISTKLWIIRTPTTGTATATTKITKHTTTKTTTITNLSS